MKKIQKAIVIIGILVFNLLIIEIAIADNNPEVYLDQFERGNKQTVTAYDIDSLTIIRGDVVFKLGKGQAALVNFGWDKPSAMVCKFPGKLIYTPTEDVEKYQLLKNKDITEFNHEFKNAVFFFTGPIQNLFPGAPTSRELSDNEWGKISAAKSDAITHLGIYLPNKILDDLLSGASGNFFYADFSLNDIGHVAYVEDPTQDDWYRFYEIKRSAGSQASEVLVGFSPYDRPPIDRGVMPINIYHYDISSNIEADGGMVATCRISFVPILQGKKFIYLNWYSDNEMGKVVDSQGRPVQTISKKEGKDVFDIGRQGSGVGLILNDVMTMGDSDYVDISYRCNTLNKKSTLFFIKDETGWYPRSIFPDEATYSLTFVCPKKYQVICSGDQVSVEEKDDNRISKFEINTPVEVVGFNIGDFKSKVIKAEGFAPVAVYLAQEIADASLAKPRDFLEQSDSGYVNKPMDVYMAEKYQSSGAEYEDYMEDTQGDDLYYDGEYIVSSSVLDIPTTEGIQIVSGRDLAEGSNNLIDVGDTSTVVLSVTNRLGQAGSDVANSAIFFTSILGTAPYDTLKATSIPENKNSRGAPGIVYLSWDSFIREDIEGNQESARAEQVAYQWFGHLVKPSSYRDEWIINGLAKYCGMWYYEISSNKRNNFKRMMADLKDEVRYGKGLEKWERGSGMEKRPLGMGVRSEGSSAGSMVLGRRLNTSGSEDYEPVAVSKATYVFHMIRYLLRDYKTGSDDLFAAFLKDIVYNFSDMAISTAGLQLLLEQYIGGDMSWFFDQWVYGTKIPKYEFSYKSSMNSDKKYVVSCNITQLNVPEDFKMIIPVTLLFKDDKYVHMRVWVTKQKEKIDLPPVPYKPEKVIFNTYNAVLCDVDYK